MIEKNPIKRILWILLLVIIGILGAWGGPIPPSEYNSEEE